MSNGFFEPFVKTRPEIIREYTGRTNTEHTVQSENGDLIWSNRVVEHISDDFNIRLQISPGTSKQEALRLLNRMIPFIEASGVDPDSIDEADFL
jgi:hypothetical protein